MSASKRLHPIRRVRQELKSTPEEMGLREYATSAGFAKFLGRSSSSIRNVECGITTNWRNLADAIQRKTNVSSAWLLSNPGPDEPIIDVRGRPWSPTSQLDPLRQKRGAPNWRKLINACPGLLPRYIAQLVEAQLVLELSLGHHEFLERLVAVLDRSSTFENPALELSRLKAFSLISEGMDRQVGGTENTNDQMDMMLAQLLTRCTTSLTIEEMQDLLNAGDYGWAAKLANAEGEGIIGDAKRFYAKNLPSISDAMEGNHDSEQD